VAPMIIGRILRPRVPTPMADALDTD